MDITSEDPTEHACATIRALVSASLDGEANAAEESAIARHLAGCADCRRFRDAAAALNRRLRIRAGEPDPAFVALVVADARPARLGRLGWARPVLAWCAIVIAVQAFAPLVLGDADGAPAHIARHVGASTLALACALSFAVWRPHRAYGLLPFVGALTAATLAAAVVDTASGNRSALAEATHLAEIVGTFVLWVVAGSPGWERFVRWTRPASGALRSTR